MAYLYDSTMLGAPVLSGTAGSRKSLLKACLIDGFGASGVISLAVSGGVATATFAAAHPYKRDVTMAVTGATPAGLNGNKRVLSVTSTTASFDATGIADGSASGTITAKVAGAGWIEAFAGTNLIALKPSVPEATGMLLRVDDTGTTSARVRGYEFMTDITSGVGPIPTDAMLSGGGYWDASNAASAAARPWMLVADERGFHLGISPGDSGYFWLGYAGDIASDKSGDAWGWLLTAGTAYVAASTTNVSTACNGYAGRSARGGAWLARSYAGLAGAVQAQRVGAAQNGTATDAYSGAASYSMTGAGLNAANNGLLLTPCELIHLGRRGTIPGLWHARADLVSAFAHGTIIDGTNDLAGRRLLAIKAGAALASGATPNGVVFLDLPGPRGGGTGERAVSAAGGRLRIRWPRPGPDGARAGQRVGADRVGCVEHGLTDRRVGGRLGRRGYRHDLYGRC